MTPLYSAILTEQNAKILDILHENGADVTIPTFTDDTPLALAVRFENEKAVELLLRRGANVSHSNQDGITPLHMIAVENRLKQTNNNVFLSTCSGIRIAELLVAHGANVNAIDKRAKNTPLHLGEADDKWLQFHGLI